MKKVIISSFCLFMALFANANCVTFTMDQIRNNYDKVEESQDEFGGVTVFCNGEGTKDCQASNGSCPPGKAIQTVVGQYIRMGQTSGEEYYDESTYFVWEQLGEHVVISVYMDEE